jgi:glyoxylase-like metal-dependent hydrolase (beta-lactamase superfamily II)
MIFEKVPSGVGRNFSYLIGEEKRRKGVIVDPSYKPEKILERVEKHNLEIAYIINSHSHLDHVAGTDYIRTETRAKVVMHREARLPFDIGVEDGQILKVGRLELKIIYTPGLSQDCICILVENELITGDTLFVGKVGGTGSDEAARAQYQSLHRKILTLDEKVEVYPGHNCGIRTSSTIGYEKENNPFLLQNSFEEFLYLKKNWLEYKRIHDIK